MIGWRKLMAWLLVFGLATAAMLVEKDVPPGAKDLLWSATGFFFGANVMGKFAGAKGSGEPS